MFEKTVDVLLEPGLQRPVRRLGLAHFLPPLGVQLRPDHLPHAAHLGGLQEPGLNGFEWV